MFVSINWHDFKWCWKWKIQRYDFNWSPYGFCQLRLQNLIRQNEVHRFFWWEYKMFLLISDKQSLFVSLSTVFSEAGTINCGISQRSILGPVLFLLYINNIWQALSNTHMYLYVDDTKNFYQHKDITEIDIKHFE